MKERSRSNPAAKPRRTARNPRRPRRASGWLFAAAASLLALTAPANAQRIRSGLQPASPADSAPHRLRAGVIDGVVSDTNLAGLVGAEVTVLRTNIRVHTGPNGRFRITSVPAGQYLLIVRRMGFQPTSGVVEVPESDTLRLSYALSGITNQLDPVVVTERRLSPRMAEFDSRRKLGQGEFMGLEEINRRNSVYATELMRKFNTLNVQSVAPASSSMLKYYAVSRRATGSLMTRQESPGEEPIQAGVCVMQVFVDGVRMPRPFNLDLLPSPRDLAGIEVYSGSATAPAQYAGFDSGCGVILIWTRDR